MTLNASIPIETTASPSAGRNDDVTFAFGTTTLGQVLVAATAEGICAVLLGNDRNRLMADLKQHFPDARSAESDEQLIDLVTRIVALTENPASPVDFPLDLKGSGFEIEVWQALRAIPSGRTLSYSGLAQSIGRKDAVAAKDVADACAANKIAVAVPCHRILRKDGTISGYRWGVHRKRALLKREGAI
jgi:O-6-methylguanine DNA methyltransferase